MYRSLIALCLAGCVAFEGSPPTTPDATPVVPDATVIDGSETLAEASERVTTRFQACMMLTDFVESNMTIWAELAAGAPQGKCINCHGNGEYGFIASSDPTTFFEALRMTKILLLQYLTPDLTEGPSRANMMVNTNHLLTVGQGEGGMHSMFEPQPGLDAAERFVAATQARAGCP
ncbi:MAG: hypothetical protein WKG01_32320 [Kofleriaceae bacterium]